MRSPQSRDAMILAVWGQARKLARRYAPSAPPHLTAEDLESEAMLAACRVVETYRPGGGASWKTYARRRMGGALLECLRVQRLQTRSARAFQQREAAARARLGPAATEEQIAQAMGMAERDYHYWRREYLPVSVESLEFPSSAQDRGVPLRVSDRIPDPSLPTQEDLAERLDLRRALESVPPRLRQVMLLRAEGVQVREVGKRLGVSDSRVSQMEREGIARARAVLEEKG